MGFFDKLRGEFIDIIEWTGEPNDAVMYKFDRYQNEIKNGAKLTVRPSQIAVLVNEGQFADIFQPGMHELKTQNLPILSTLKGWKYGFDSPFKAEVYFFSTKTFTNQKWGTAEPATLMDERFGMIEIRAFGSYAFKINDPIKFIESIGGLQSDINSEDMSGHIRSAVNLHFKDALGEAGLPVESYASNLKELSELMVEDLQPALINDGIELNKFFIESISMPDDIKQEIFELSRLNRIDLNKLTQMKAAKAMEKAAENPSGTAGAGMGMGMGFAMANQMGNSFTQQPQQAAPQNNSAGAPPPIPGVKKFFIAINGQQQGPFPVTQLKEMATANQINKETLVWAEGMSNWEAAGSNNDVKNIFGSIPPPIPGV